MGMDSWDGAFSVSSSYLHYLRHKNIDINDENEQSWDLVCFCGTDEALWNFKYDTVSKKCACLYILMKLSGPELRYFGIHVENSIEIWQV